MVTYHIHEFIGLEPEVYFPLGRLYTVRAVNCVNAGSVTEIATDSAKLSVFRIGSADHFAECFNDFITFPHHCDHWVICYEIYDFVEEWLFFVLSVMFTHKLFGWNSHFHGNEFEATGLDPVYNLSDQTPLHAVRLDHDVSALHFKAEEDEFVQFGLAQEQG